MIALLLLLLAVPAQAQPRSGYADAGPTVRAMQDDDTANPAFFAVEQGRALWTEGRPSCAACHGDVATLRGVAATYPRFDPARGRVLTLPQRVNLCRTTHQAAPALAPDSEAMLGLTALIGLQSRGMALAVDTAGPAQAALARGRAFFFLRQGQFNLACANCHDDLAGRHLGGALIPQGHPNAYPIYRLAWDGVGSLARRLRQCLAGVRAAPLDPDSEAFADLAFYLADRARGLPVETPGVRP